MGISANKNEWTDKKPKMTCRDCFQRRKCYNETMNLQIFSEHGALLAEGPLADSFAIGPAILRRAGPVVTVVTATLILKEPFTATLAVGTALTLLGLILSEGNFSREKPVKEKRNRI